MTEEQLRNDDHPWLAVHKDGVAELDTPGQQVAIYQLVEVGRVKIAKSFISTRKARRNR